MNKLKLRRNQESVNNSQLIMLTKMLTMPAVFLNVRKCELRDNEKTN